MSSLTRLATLAKLGLGAGTPCRCEDFEVVHLCSSRCRQLLSYDVVNFAMEEVARLPGCDVVSCAVTQLLSCAVVR